MSRRTSVLVAPVTRVWLRLPRWAHVLVALALLAVAIGVPTTLSTYWQSVLFFPVGIYIVLALGLNIVVGFAGLLDLGYVAFYAMGAYTAGWFASSQFSHEKVNLGAVGLYPGATGIHLSMWLVLPMAGIITAVAGVLIGLPTLRLRGDYLAIVTLGFGEILPQVARNGDHLFGTNVNLTNGTEGITPIDPPGFGNWLGTHLHLPANFFTARGLGTGDTLDAVFFWTAIVLVLITIFCSARLRDSRVGRAWIAIR
jgi:branched-chain amino acid transport system permease protein